MKRRVVITGLGVVHSLGKEVPDFWNSIKEGKNGIKKITKFDTSDFTTKVGAQIDDFDPTQYIEKKKPRGWICLPNMPLSPHSRQLIWQV